MFGIRQFKYFNEALKCKIKLPNKYFYNQKHVVGKLTLNYCHGNYLESKMFSLNTTFNI